MAVDPITAQIIAGHLDDIDDATDAIRGLLGVVDPPDPPDPPPAEYLLSIQAETMRLRDARSMVVETDKPGHTGSGSIGFWGHAGEALEFDIDVLTADDHTDELQFRYGNGGTAEQLREVTVTKGREVLAAATLSFPPTAAWGTPEQWADDVVWDLTLPQGRYSVAIECVGDGAFLDLDTVSLRSSQAVNDTTAPDTGPPPVPTPPPGVPIPPVPAAGTTIWHVPAQGSLQSVLDRARPGDFVYVSGIVAANGYGYQGVNRDCGQGREITIVGLPGHVLRCGASGFEGFGSMRGWDLWNLNWEISGAGYYNSGVSFYGQRTDHGADGAGCARIGIYNMVLRPIPGTGRIQRDGITLWGGDLLVVDHADISGASYNDLGFFGGAGSAISIGDTIASPTAGSVHPTISGVRVWCHHALVRDQHGPGSDSADRNGINLDNYMKTGRRLVGATLLEDNDIADCDGRGILAAWAGFDDSPILIRRNKVRAPMSQRLGGSFPGGIVAAAFNIHSNIEITDNDVEVSPGYPAYHFDGVVAGVRGSGNKGGPIVGPVPAGFSA